MIFLFVTWKNMKQCVPQSWAKNGLYEAEEEEEHTK